MPARGNVPRHECILHCSVVRLPPRSNVPAQRTRLSNAFTAARADRMAMRPFTKLLWTLVYVCIQYLTKRVAGKNVSEMTYFVSSGT